MYNTTAFLYDTIAAAEDPKAVFGHIHTLLLEAGIRQPAAVGDFGCGTGTMAVQFAEFGWRVIGVELSEAMLAVAQSKASGLSQAIQSRLGWVHGDISEPALVDKIRDKTTLPLEAVVCLHNTINHLVQWPQVEGFIANAFAVLKPGGVLVLDSDTLLTFENFFNHPPTVVWDDGAHRVTRTCFFNAETGRAEHTALLERYESDSISEGISEGRIAYVDTEVMGLQYYPEAQLNSAFLAAGFTLRALQPYNPSPALYEGGFIPKALWVLQKPI